MIFTSRDDEKKILSKLALFELLIKKVTLLTLFLFKGPMNLYQCRMAKLDRALFSMIQYCKITVWVEFKSEKAIQNRLEIKKYFMLTSRTTIIQNKDCC